MKNDGLGGALFKYRTDNRLSQQQMGDMLDMSRQSYDRLEKGFRKATYEEFRRCSKVIGWDISAGNGVAPPIPVSTRKWELYNLKRSILYSTIDLEDVLVEMKDLAKAVDCPVLLDWTHYELMGYFATDVVPTYRLYARTVEVDYKNGREKIFNLVVPAEIIDPSQKYPDIFTFTTGLNGFEAMLALGDAKSIEGAPELKAHMHSILQETYGQNIEVRRVAFVISTRTLLKVLMAVQEILLTFLSDLERKFGREPYIDDLRAANHLVSDLLIKAKKLTGDASHLDTPFKPRPVKDVELVKGDYDAFRIWCEDHDLMEYDELLDEFLDLLEEQEKAPPPSGVIPPKVYDWVNKVVEENARFGPNGEKLIDALKIFYGVKY